MDPEHGTLRAYTPKRIRFKDGGKIRPVAPFLEVWARTSDQTLEPLTLDLLKQEELDPSALRWNVKVANIKAFRRTNDEGDRIVAEVKSLNDHASHPLIGKCSNFLTEKAIPFGNVRYVRPTKEFPQIRLRFTPAAGYVYGAADKRHTSDSAEEHDPVLEPERIVSRSSARPMARLARTIFRTCIY